MHILVWEEMKEMMEKVVSKHLDPASCTCIQTTLNGICLKKVHLI